MDEFINKQTNSNSANAIDEALFNDDGTDDIWEAARLGSLTGVKYYIHVNRSNLNNPQPFSNRTPLHWASDEGHLNVVRFLLSDLAAVDPKGEFRRTPLMLACRSGHISIVNLLLDNGADINHADKDLETPLFEAIAGDHLDILKLLIRRGANIKFKNDHGMTPLDYAISRGFRTPIVNYLKSLYD